VSRAFLEIGRAALAKRPVEERLGDWREVERDLPAPELQAQASRCMDCGIPFCHAGCPLGNHVPDWNEALAAGRTEGAVERLHSTNNFPEITGRICPAPCEDACVLGLHGAPVTIRQVEKQLGDAALAQGLQAHPPRQESGRTVAIVGSGPAGLAAAQQLRRAGHAVTVFERHDRPGGLLRYGIPDFKLDRAVLDQRLDQLRAEGVVFRCGVSVGDDVTLDALRSDHDAVLLAVGAWHPRELPLPGRDLPGVHPALDYLVQANRRVAGLPVDDPIDVRGETVLVLGGGDTGADCLGTALRDGAARVLHWHYKPPPPTERGAEQPWPFPPALLRPSSSHEEGGERGWSVVAKAFVGDDRVKAIRCVDVSWEGGSMRELPETEREVLVDRVLLAVGFVGALARRRRRPRRRVGLRRRPRRREPGGDRDPRRAPGGPGDRREAHRPSPPGRPPRRTDPSCRALTT